MDVKRLGKTPTAAAGATSDAPSGKRNRARSDPYRRAGKIRGPLPGHGFVHTVIDDHSRVVHAEVHDDKTAATATALLRRAVAWFTARGIPTERVLFDNGPAYRPQTSGKIERFHRSLADGWRYVRCYSSEDERRLALPA